MACIAPLTRGRTSLLDNISEIFCSNRLVAFGLPAFGLAYLPARYTRYFLFLGEIATFKYFAVSSLAELAVTQIEAKVCEHFFEKPTDFSPIAKVVFVAISILGTASITFLFFYYVFPGSLAFTFTRQILFTTAMIGGHYLLKKACTYVEMYPLSKQEKEIEDAIEQMSWPKEKEAQIQFVKGEKKESVSQQAVEQEMKEQTAQASKIQSGFQRRIDLKVQLLKNQIDQAEKTPDYRIQNTKWEEVQQIIWEIFDEYKKAAQILSSDPGKKIDTIRSETVQRASRQCENRCFYQKKLVALFPDFLRDLYKTLPPEKRELKREKSEKEEVLDLKNFQVTIERFFSFSMS